MGELYTLDESGGKRKQSELESDESIEDRIEEMLLNSREQCQMIEQLINNQIKIKDERIDKLYKELEYYKQDEASRYVEQVMKAVIKVRKDMDKMINSDRWSNVSAEDVKKEYQYIFEDVTDLLEQQNIDAYRSNAGDDFDAAIHQPKTEATSDIALDKKIKESISDGYKRGEKVIIPERVIVYQYKG